MKKIMLQKTTSGIMAHWYDTAGNPDQKIIDLFGTHIIPTAYSVDIELATKEIGRLNPGYVLTTKNGMES